jgi:D-alanyl-D-alanine carboxypeptidase
MKDKNAPAFLAIALLGALLFSLITIYASAEGSKALKKNIDVSARAAVLYEPTTKRILYSKNADERLPMASTTKIMTAIIALENADINDYVTVDEKAVGVEGSSAYLKAGEILKLEELIYALMLQSANDAAEAIAYHVAGDINSFADMMNEKARALGLENTNFENPHGLDAENHYTTAKDLSIIAAYALDNPFLRTVSSTYKRTFTSTEKQRTFVNHNKLLLRFNGAIGLKTGFTKKSGRCLVGSAEKDGLRLITVTLNAPCDWADHASMLDYGFSELEMVSLLEKDEINYTIPVLNGHLSAVRVTCKNALSQVLPRNNREIKKYIKLQPMLTAPINKGDVVGTVIITSDGTQIGEVELIAEETVMKKSRNIFSIKTLKRLTKQGSF